MSWRPEWEEADDDTFTDLRDLSDLATDPDSGIRSRPRFSSRPPPMNWSPTSYKSHANSQAVPYDDPAALARTQETLSRMPPLVTSWGIERLREQIAQ